MRLIPLHEQILAEASLGFADLMAQGGLGESEHCGSARDAAGTRHGLQHAQVAHFQSGLKQSFGSILPAT